MGTPNRPPFMPMPKLVIFFVSFPSRATTICVTMAWPVDVTPLTPAALFEPLDELDAGEATDCSVLQILFGLLSWSWS